jgi:hypothetical protein
VTATASAPIFDIASFVPASLRTLADPQKDLPRIAKDAELISEIEASVHTFPTHHRLARCMGIIDDRGLELEAQMYGAAGGRPQVVWPNGVLASLAVGLFAQLVTPWSKTEDLPILLEYDGNAQTVLPSSKLFYLKGRECTHFAGLASLGDPFWKRPDAWKQTAAAKS